MGAILRMRNFIKGRHWFANDYFYYEAAYNHAKRWHDRPVRKRKYGLRKSYFVKYESHRNKNVDYLPF